MAAPTWWTNSFGASSDFLVEVAWGADLTADPSGWSWTDITADVYQDPGISTRKGRSDEAGVSQPADFTCRLDNASGDYSTGATGTNYPNVRRGTPVRFRIDPAGAGYYTVFQGEAVGFTPGWDLTGDIPVVTLKAAGSLRRLSQGQSPVESSLRRGIRAAAGVVAYWPCEEGKGATQFAPAVGTFPLTFWAGTPALAAYDDFPSSLPLPTLNHSAWTGVIGPHTDTGVISVQALVAFPTADADEAAASCILSLRTDSSSAGYWDLIQNAGDLQVAVYDASATLVTVLGPVAFDVDAAPDRRRWSLTLQQNGADVDVEYGTLDATGVFSGGYAIDTVTGVDLGVATAIAINVGAPGPIMFLGDAKSVAVGHVAVYNTVQDVTSLANEVGAWTGETATARLARLCDEADETITVTGESDITMGPQSVANLVDLLRECEAADGGILYDGDGPGLAYRARYLRENATPVLELDASTGTHVAPGFEAVDDDARTRNKAIITRTGGSAATVTDTDGPMGTDVIGIYDTSATVNVQHDDQAAQLAAWTVHVGTIGGLRYPSLPLNLRAAPSKATAVLGLYPGARIDVDNLDNTLAGHPVEEPLGLAVEGIAHQLSAGEWLTSTVCSPYSPWEIAVLSSETGAIEDMTAGTVEVTATPGSVLPAIPAGGTHAGDLLIACLSVRTGTLDLIDPDSGWFLVDDEETNAGTDGSIAMWAKVVAENTEVVEGVWLVTGGAANGVSVCQLLRVRGAHPDPAQVVYGSAASYNASAANITVPGLTIADPLILSIVFGWRRDDWTSVAQLSGQFFTEITDNPTTTGDDAGIDVQYRVLLGSGNVTATSLVVTGGAAAVGRCIVAAFRPNPDPRYTILDTDGSTLDGSVAQGATSISVATTSGPLWSTTAGDYPLDLDVDGVRYHVTACADATSPQTMTIDAAPAARSAGAAVKVWRPPVLGR